MRLDRNVANIAWSDRFPDAQLQHLTTPRSDHKALLLIPYQESQAVRSSTFRYEIMWEREEELSTVIETAWKKRYPGSNLGALTTALQAVTTELKSWNRNKFGHVARQLEKLRMDLEVLERDDPISNQDTILKTKRDLDELLYREEMMWLQRSRVSWLKVGDHNTKFFHGKVRWRARKNHIKKLKMEDGNWCTDQQTMRGMAVNYFENLFSMDAQVDPQDIVNLLEPSVSAQAMQLSAVSIARIGTALFQIGPLKAPGPDGLPSRFFQRNWSLLKEDVVRTVKEFFATGIMPPGVNDTCIVLIPKVPHPEDLRISGL